LRGIMHEPISHRCIPRIVGDGGYRGAHIKEQDACNESLQYIFRPRGVILKVTELRWDRLIS
jgi:hypothetical protein